MARNEPKIRCSVPDDSEFAFQVWKAAMEQYIDATWGWDEDVQRERQKQEFAMMAHQIIEVADQPVGTCIVERQPDHFYISGLYLLPKHQNQGIGSQVINLLSSEAKAHNLPARLRVLNANPAARRFYERHGFVVIDETENSFMIMEKAL